MARYQATLRFFAFLCGTSKIHICRVLDFQKPFVLTSSDKDLSENKVSTSRNKALASMLNYPVYLVYTIW